MTDTMNPPSKYQMRSMKILEAISALKQADILYYSPMKGGWFAVDEHKRIAEIVKELENWL